MDVVTSPSRFVAERLREAGLGRPVRVIPNGLGDVAPRPAPSDRSGPLRVGFFGNPLPTKGLDVLVAAFASLPPGAATLDLHGPGPEHLPGPTPGAMAHGPYSPGEALDLMKRVDLVAIPSTWDENQPMVALEARAAGRPLMVSDRGGLPELVRDGLDGWVLPAGEAEAWGELLARLCAIRSEVLAAAALVAPPATSEEMAEAFERAWQGTTIDAVRVDSDRPASGE